MILFLALMVVLLKRRLFMNINFIRSILYALGKYLGDGQAVTRSVSSGSFIPLIQHLFRRLYGKIAGRGFNLFKW